MKKVPGNYLGLVINTNDPELRGRIQVFIPHISTTLYTGWNEKLQDISFRSFTNPPFTDELQEKLKSLLPWAEAAVPFWGGGSGAPIYEPTSTPTPIPTDQNLNGGGEGGGGGGGDIDLTNVPEDAQVGDPRQVQEKDGINNPAGEREATTKAIGGDSASTKNWSVSFKDRNGVGYNGKNSVPGNRFISLDFNSHENGANIDTPLIVIPDDATPEERQLAQQYVNKTAALLINNGVPSNPVGIVKTRSENGSGKNGIFHTEPFFIENKAAFDVIKNNSGAYAQIMTETLGKISGAKFIIPHEPSRGLNGAPGQGTNEVDFAKKYLYPKLKILADGGSLGSEAEAEALAAAESAETGDGGANVLHPTGMFGDAYGSVSTSRAGGPMGFFSIPAVNAKVWVFFEGENPQFPVYFANAYEPSNAKAVDPPFETPEEALSDLDEPEPALPPIPEDTTPLEEAPLLPPLPDNEDA